MGFSASTAARKNCLTAASLYFCWVSTATSTSAAWRIAVARCQLTSTSESTSGASRSSSRGGMVWLMPPEQPVLGRILERIVGRPPGVQLERLEQPPEQGRIGQVRRHKTHRVLRAGGQRAGGAGHLAGQEVEDHRLADVRAADDRHDQQRRQIELRQELVPQQVEPLLPRGRRHAQRGRLRRQRLKRPIEPLHLTGEGLVGRHERRRAWADGRSMARVVRDNDSDALTPRGLTAAVGERTAIVLQEMVPIAGRRQSRFCWPAVSRPPRN